MRAVRCTAGDRGRPLYFLHCTEEEGRAGCTKAVPSCQDFLPENFWGMYRASCVTQILHQCIKDTGTSVTGKCNHGCKTGHAKEMLELWSLIKLCLVFHLELEYYVDFQRHFKCMLLSYFGQGCGQLVPPSLCRSFTGRWHRKSAWNWYFLVPLCILQFLCGFAVAQNVYKHNPQSPFVLSHFLPKQEWSGLDFAVISDVHAIYLQWCRKGAATSVGDRGWLAGGEASALHLKAKVQNFAQIKGAQLFT